MSESGHRYVEFSGEKRYFATKITEQAGYESTNLDKVVEIIKTLPLEEKNEISTDQMTLDGKYPRKFVRTSESSSVKGPESSPAAGLTYIESKLNEDLEANFYDALELRNGLQEIRSIIQL